MDLDTNEASTLVPLNSEFGRDREEEIGSGVVEKSSQS